MRGGPGRSRERRVVNGVGSTSDLMRGQVLAARGSGASRPKQHGRRTGRARRSWPLEGAAQFQSSLRACYSSCAEVLAARGSGARRSEHAHARCRARAGPGRSRERRARSSTANAACASAGRSWPLEGAAPQTHARQIAAYALWRGQVLAARGSGAVSASEHRAGRSARGLSRSGERREPVELAHRRSRCRRRCRRKLELQGFSVSIEERGQVLAGGGVGAIITVCCGPHAVARRGSQPAEASAHPVELGAPAGLPRREVLAGGGVGAPLTQTPAEELLMRGKVLAGGGVGAMARARSRCLCPARRGPGRRRRRRWVIA